MPLPHLHHVLHQVRPYVHALHHANHQSVVACTACACRKDGTGQPAIEGGWCTLLLGARAYRARARSKEDKQAQRGSRQQKKGERTKGGKSERREKGDEEGKHRRETREVARGREQEAPQKEEEEESSRQQPDPTNASRS